MNPDKQRKRMEKAQKLIRKVDAAVVKARAEAAARQQEDPYATHVQKMAAVTGNAGAREERERLELEKVGASAEREYATRILKSSTSAEARQVAQARLDQLDADDRGRLQREEQLRKQGWSR